MFIDEAVITIQAGRGGNGAVSFRREKYVDKGGPDGGDGGNGGNIIFVASGRTDTLADYARLKNFKATSGSDGSKSNRHGKNGDDLTLYVPPGTIIYDVTSKNTMADLKNNDEKIVAANGGRGGLGNIHFATATHQVPREFKPGEVGEKRTIKLELKLIADVGIIGLPNAGKSTLICAISNAKPKIADYPFTTLEPVLGVVQYDDKRFVICDIPGLIENASQGKGLGHKFLRHIERTKILVHLIDAGSTDLQRDYNTIRMELKKFNPKLAEKKEIIVLSKVDTVSKLPKEMKFDRAISAATGKGIKELLGLILNNL